MQVGGYLLGIGEELKRIREEKGLSIYDVENQTKIKATFIDAIEKENFDKIPGRVYVKGFIKNYAKFLGLDYTVYLQEINKHFKEDNSEDILANSKPQLVRPVKEKRLSDRIIKGISLLLVLALLLFGGYKGFEYFMSEKAKEPQVSEEKPEVQPDPQPEKEAEPAAPATEPDPAPVTEPEPQPEPEPTPATEPEAQPQPEVTPPAQPVAEKMELEVIMSEGGPGLDSCWIQVIVDGKLEFEQTIFAGREPMKFTGYKTIDFTYGNGAAVRIKVNGVDQGVLGAQAEVGTRRYKIEDL
jgi:cytoskeletal protein RodZ